jgi:general secretion pathway protein L
MTIAANRPIKGAHPRARGGRALAWWLGELRACRDDLRRVLATRGTRGITVEVGERYWLLRQGQRPIGQVDAQSDETAQLRRLMPSDSRRPIIVEIPPERALAKTIALPAEAAGQLNRVLDFEITRHFPFPAERVYFRHRIVERGETASPLSVEIVAVPREIVDGVCATLAEAGLRPVAVAIHGADGEPLFLPAEVLALSRREAAPTTRMLGVAAGLALLTALVSWPLAQRAELRAMDGEIATLKPRAEATLAAGEAERGARERSAAIFALRASRPPLVSALDALSRDLPDGAWLMSLSISGRDVVLDGLAPSAAGIALTLDKSRDLTGIVFRSPITRESSGLEHFQLGATLPEAKP